MGEEKGAGFRRVGKDNMGEKVEEEIAALIESLAKTLLRESWREEGKS